MRPKLALGFILLCGFDDSGCDCRGNPPPIPPEPPRADWPLPGFDAAYAKLDAHVAGYAYAFAEAGAITAGAHGWAATPADGGEQMTSTTRIHIASISKPITAAAIMTLVDSHDVNLDTPFMHWLGDEFTDVAPGVKAVTLRQLLTHTSGLAQWGYCGPQLHDQLRDMLKTSMEHAAPAPASYNNGNFCLLRRVIEVISERDYVTYVRDAVLAPMGIIDMTCAPDTTRYYAKDGNNTQGLYWSADWSAHCGAYGWFGSATDLARFGEGLRRHVAMSEASWRDMVAGRLGLWTTETSAGTAFHHNGGWVTGDQGFHGMMVLFPRGLTAVLLINTWGIDSGGPLFDGYADYLKAE